MEIVLPAMVGAAELLLVVWLMQSVARRGFIGTWTRLKHPIRIALDRVMHGPALAPGPNYDQITAAEREIYGEVLTRPPQEPG